MKRLLIFFVLVLLVVSSAGLNAAGGFPDIQPARVLQPLEEEFTVYWRSERERTERRPSGVEYNYDNTRLFPIMVRAGLEEEFLNFQSEVGAWAAISSNSGDYSWRALESLNFYGKVKLLDGVALSGGLSTGGTDEVRPYGNEGLDFWINLPAEIEVDTGSYLYAEAGYTFKGGDFENYPSLGVGYRTGEGSGNKRYLEVRGHGELYALESAGSNSFLEVEAGLQIALERGSYLLPSVGMGLDTGSPEYSLGLRYRVTSAGR